MSFLKLGTVSALAIMVAGGALAKSDITVAMQLEPPHLDPTSAAAGAIDSVLYSNVFEGLTRFGPNENVVEVPVFFQPDDRGSGKMVREGKDIFDLSPPESINALGIVADHHDIFAIACKQVNNVRLNLIGVLVFITKDELKQGLVPQPDVRVVPQQVARKEKDIVEVDSIGRFEHAFVALIDIEQADIALPGVSVEIGAWVSAVFGVGNLSQHAHGMFFIEVEPQQDFLDGLLLVVGREHLQRHVVPQQMTVFFQDLETG